MRYAEATYRDSSPIKRFFQRRRLSDALACVDRGYATDTIIDFGGGDGEFSVMLAARFPESRIYCFEPSPWQAKEAEERLAGWSSITLASSLDAMPRGECGLLFCNEVFEHFLPEGTESAIRQIIGLTRKDALIVIGVPIEIGIPALYKGVFRMMRRYGDFDAMPSTVLRSVMGMPPRDRPVHDMGPGLPFHLPHVGFDHRVLLGRLEKDFKLLRTRCSPAPRLGSLLNNEIYFILRRLK